MRLLDRKRSDFRGRRKYRMAREIRIKVGSVMALAELNDSKTAEAIWQALPLRGNINT